MHNEQTRQQRKATAADTRTKHNKNIYKQATTKTLRQKSKPKKANNKLSTQQHIIQQYASDNAHHQNQGGQQTKIQATNNKVTAKQTNNKHSKQTTVQTTIHTTSTINKRNKGETNINTNSNNNN